TAPCVALQTQGGVTTEQTVALTGGAVTQREAGLDLENGLQAIAQIFSTTQTPTVTGLNTVNQTEALGVLNTEAFSFNFLVAETAVKNTVQGHGRFCLGNAGKAKRKSSSEQSLFHVRNLRRFE